MTGFTGEGKLRLLVGMDKIVEVVENISIIDVDGSYGKVSIISIILLRMGLTRLVYFLDDLLDTVNLSLFLFVSPL